MRTLKAVESQPPLTEQVYQAIRDAICDGTFKPGERLTQDGLADQLQVSRQPIGQALKVLKAQRFVTEAGRRGVQVSHLEAKVIANIYDVRAALDGLAAERALEHWTPAMTLRLQSILKSGEQAISEGSLEGVLKADRLFHELIYDVSGNQLINEMMELYWHHVRRAMNNLFSLDGPRARKSLGEHVAILEALKKGDADRVSRLARQHAENAKAAIMKKIEDPMADAAR